MINSVVVFLLALVNLHRYLVWRERNRVTFDNEAFFAHRLKRCFVYNFWSWSNVYSGDRDRSLLDFLTWMGYGYFFGMVGFLELLAPFLAVPS